MEPATSGLRRLIYLSRQRLERPWLADEEVDDIVRASIRNNRAVALTGLLLVHDGWFMQVLEGPKAALEATYARIIRDPRHAEVRVLETADAEAREFGGWNMCARRMSDVDEAILSELDRRANLALDRLNGRTALRLLKAVREIQGQPGSRRYA